jgi:acyl-CoA thioester hydrolase
MLRSLGMDYAAMEATGIMLPVLELSSKFIKPALYDQEITVKTTIEELPGIRIHFKYELFNEAEELINIGATTLVFVDMVKKKPCLPPADFMKKVQQWFKPEDRSK